MNKPVYLGLSIPEISKTLMYEFWYEYIKLKYQDNVKFCYMDTDSFIIYIKTKDFYKDLKMMLRKDLMHQIMMSVDHYPQEKNKKVIGLMKNELGGKIMTEIFALRPKTYSYIMGDGKNDTQVTKMQKEQRNV